MKRVAWLGLIVFSLVAGTRIVRADAPPVPENLAATWFQNPGGVDPSSADLQFVGDRCRGGGGGYGSYPYFSGYGSWPGYGYGSLNQGYYNPYAYQSLYMGYPTRQVYSSGYWNQFPNLGSWNSYYYYNNYRPSVYPTPRIYYRPPIGYPSCR